MQNALTYLSLLLFIIALSLPAVNLEPWLPGIGVLFLSFVGVFLGLIGSFWHWIACLLGAAANLLLLATAIRLLRGRTSLARCAAFTALICSLLVLPALSGINPTGFGMVSFGYWLWVGSALVLAMASLTTPTAAAASAGRAPESKSGSPTGEAVASDEPAISAGAPRKTFPKRTVGVVCVAISLAAWMFKAGPAMGLALVGMGVAGAIFGLIRKRPTGTGPAVAPAAICSTPGAGFLKAWLTRGRPVNWYHQVLLFWVALPLAAWWPTGVQLIDAVAENRPGKARLCLALGADVNATRAVIPHAWYLGTPGVRTPLFEAIQTSNLPLVELLLRHGADPNQFCGEPNEVRSPINSTQDPEIIAALRRAIAARHEGTLP